MFCVWNYDGRGDTSEFGGTDLVLVANGEYYTSTFDASNHYEDNILRIEKFRNPERHLSAILLILGPRLHQTFPFEQTANRNS